MRIPILLLTIAAAAVGSERQAAAESQKPKVQTMQYVVKKGDSCIGIASRVLGHRRHYRSIHRLNQLGRLPHVLRPGQILILPKRSRVRADAKLTSRSGTVRVRRPSVVRWASGRRGMDLFKAWRVNSLERSSAEITYRDSTKIRLRENTLVVIYGAISKNRRRQGATARLERGTLRSRLAAMSPRRFFIATASSVAELGVGSAVVSVDAKGTSRVANHSGAAVVVRGVKKRRRRRRRARRVKVRKGMGTKVVRGKPPTKPRPLPAPPVWQPGPTSFFAVGASTGTIRGSWEPVKGAASYRVVVSAVSNAPLAVIRVPATTNRFEARNLPPSKYRVSVATIDDDAFEGIPSKAKDFTLFELKADHGPVAPNGAFRFGTRLTIPKALNCTDEKGGRVTSLLLDRFDPIEITCTAPDGTSYKRKVLAAPVRLRTPTVANVLPRNTQVRIRAPFDNPAAVPKSVQVRGAGGVTIQRTSVEAGELVVVLTATSGASTSLALDVAVVVANRFISVAKLPLRFTPAPKARSAPVTVAKLAGGAPSKNNPYLAGVFVGADYIGMDSGLGNTTRGATPRSSGTVGLRAGYRARSMLQLEVEMKVTPTQTRQDRAGSVVVGWRAHALIPLRPRRAVEPFALVGGGGETYRSRSGLPDPDTDWAAYWGVGVQTGSPHSATGLRLDLRHRVSPTRHNNLDSGFELQLGLFRRFGG